MRQTMQTTGAARRTMIGAAGRADMAGTSARPWPAAPRPIITRDVAAPYDAELVIYRLEEAGSTLLALPQGGYSTRLRTQNLEIARDDADLIPAPGSEAGPLRPPVPSASRITRMDETLAWIPLIPRERHVLRRIVGARALVSPVTERHLFSWRRLGGMIGADHKAVQRWHAQGIDLIVAALNAREGVMR